MKNLFFFFVILVNYSFSQNFPYLNASTGNPDFFTDQDTNMFIIHGNRLAKVNKSFSPVWVNTYGSLTLKKVLLSKTGSMYFIALITPTSTAQNYVVGKMNAAGNISWMKSVSGMPVTIVGSAVNSLTLNAESLFLDSNNNLLVSGVVSAPGNAGLIKMDTLGNFIKGRLFLISEFTSLSGGLIGSSNILNQAQGLTNIITIGVTYGNFKMMRNFAYSDAGDSVNYSTTVGLGGCTNCTSSFEFRFFKSKTRSDVFYLFGHVFIDFPSPNATPYHFVLSKFTMNSGIWSQGHRWTGAPATIGNGLDEDEKGNVFGVINTTNSMSSHHSGFVKFDSTGAFNGTWIKYFNGYNQNSFYYPDDRVNVIHYNKYFMNVTGSGYPTNPLTTENISPSLGMSCASSVSLAVVSTAGASTVAVGQNPTQYTVTTLTMPNVTPTVNSVTNFSVNANFCITLGSLENEIGKEIFVYPNPTTGILKVHMDGNNTIELYDVNGKKILESKSMAKEQEIDLSKLPLGVYILKTGTSVRKVVKED